jgi:hypothetical protein
MSERDSEEHPYKAGGLGACGEGKSAGSVPGNQGIL